MAHYVTSVRSDRAAEAAFDFVADLRNLEAWDPGVRKSVQVIGDGVGPDSAYDVTIASPPGMTLRYETSAIDRPRSVTLIARTTFFTSVDVITAVDDGDGSIVTYDATLTLNGPLGLADLVLRPVFQRIGDKAAKGLRRSLDGETVA